jgi:hypothetical protein
LFSHAQGTVQGRNADGHLVNLIQRRLQRLNSKVTKVSGQIKVRRKLHG